MISTYLAGKFLNKLRGTDFTPPATMYVALFKTAPTRSTPGTEPTDTAYQRQLITLTAPTEAAGKTTVKNVSLITFAPAEADWGNIAYFGILDAATSGNLLLTGTVNVPKYVEADDQVKIQANELLATLE